MRIPRLYLPAEYQSGRVLDLTKDQAHYALTVLRLKAEHPLEVFDGEGHQAQAQLQILNKREAQITLGEIQRPNTESPLNTLLIQGISRGERMDYSLQKAVELGVSAIQPVFTERCEVRLDPQKAEKRRQQWQALVISACEQSGRCVVPIVRPLITLNTWFSDHPQQPGLVLDPYAQQTLMTFKPEQMQTTELALLIGPEGGLSETEVEQAKTNGLTAVRLGPRVLRTETAAPVVLSLLQAQWGDLNAS
ncbi:MAG: 16S rRNA (uracil(1498)-N(3))-methyltransferase [Thiomicrospira sp.]|uniref:16S rRNA (uracil(1498)-N(3))-methyltransferase n=1 Tax=Thiomicrospira sp. TaxID=935 RepID=UPI0019DE50DD|nr:16S rRNA (uracil(1498)-N(3))-methyltransferase [Thiomicrospira sp.]MBE0493086.1 16S rRNA (uracil(1498)-N(3))-methyltransferase [Thiomicrospira sp.]